MATVATSQLFSHQTFQDLVLDPLFQESKVLGAIRRIDTDATVAYIPRVTPGNIGWVAEGAELPDANLGADLLAVQPAKLGAVVTVSNESLEDANAAGILGQALARQLASSVDTAFSRPVAASPRSDSPG